MVKKNHSSTKVYIVEDILDTKINGGCQFYKVKWKGYTHAECTWEPEESFNCSRDILDQFLQARAKKQPSFKEKLRKIQREKELIEKNGTKVVEKTKHIKKGKKQAKQEENSESQVGGRKGLKQEEEEYNSEESGNLQSQREKQSESSGVKIEYDQPKKTSQKPLNTERQSSKSKQTSSNPEPTKAKSSTTSTKPILKPSILPKKEQLEIMKVQKAGQGLRFYVRQNEKKVWKTREEMHQKYLRELCEYYEKHLSFDS